jgi:hypothetical protein
MSKKENEMAELTISLNDEESALLKKRAKKNLLTVKEQAEDIIRRSCLSYKKQTYSSEKPDDTLIEIFSRQKKGRKRK